MKFAETMAYPYMYNSSSLSTYPGTTHLTYYKQKYPDLPAFYFDPLINLI